MKRRLIILIAVMLILGLIGATGSATAAGYFDKGGEGAVPISSIVSIPKTPDKIHFRF